MKTLHQTIVLGLICVAGLSCSSADYDQTASVKDRKALQAEEIVFQAGKPTLGASEKRKLDALINNARARGKIDDVKVLAWADKDYLSEGVKAPPFQVDLAQARAREIEKYIHDKLDFTSIDSHNMAKQPGTLARLFKTDEYELKVGAYDKNGVPFKANSEPKKALVVVEMESDR